MNEERVINEFLLDNKVKSLGGSITKEGQRNGFRIAKSAIQLLLAERKDNGMPLILTEAEINQLMDNLVKW
tara:strand:+ start:274 stop:486 length:213 start_codon:yes stop_codon:yes gene_type:complete